MSLKSFVDFFCSDIHVAIYSVSLNDIERNNKYTFLSLTNILLLDINFKN